MSYKQIHGKYTQEFKLAAVRQVETGQSVSVVAKVLGIPRASPGNWVRQSCGGNDLTRIELHRGPRAVTITWPVATASACASWLCELLR
jgi:transposase-like protein